MITYIYYRETDGEIVGWETATEIEPPPATDGEHSILGFLSFQPNPTTQKVSHNAIVDKTPEEVEVSQQPSLMDIKALVFSELCNTDGMMSSDRSASDTALWATYRKALREMSKRVSISEMTALWPVRPDGANALAQWRSSKAQSSLV